MENKVDPQLDHAQSTGRSNMEASTSAPATPAVPLTREPALPWGSTAPPAAVKKEEESVKVECASVQEGLSLAALGLEAGSRIEVSSL